MKREGAAKRKNKEPLDRISGHFFLVILGFCVGLAGMNIGLIYLLVNVLQWPVILIVHIILFYWLIAAWLLTIYLRGQVRMYYEKPARMISEAAKEISGGNFDISIPPIHEDPERQDFFDGTIRDVNKMAQELHSIETLKTDFISNVSHEMKTPLSVIRNYADLLAASKTEDPKNREYAEIIADNAGKMAELISNILRLNRIENQRIIPDVERYDLIRQLSDCVLGFETVWEEKQIEIDVDLEDRCYIKSDRSLLELVWNNLLSNAFKFTEPDGTVSVKQTTKDGTVIVSVSDTGCGMSEETVRHIFDKFYQGDTSHSSEGNGLGLALASRVISLLGGDLKVESKEGEGSTFTVILQTGE